MLVLGIETSCDETAAALVTDGVHIHSSIVSSQVEIHRPYGGVVPELASRKHMENILPVVREAFDTAGKDMADLDAVAATRGPGLVGALLVGFSFAKAFAYARGIPYVGVNHLEGHINSLFLEDNPPEFPFVALLVSGGHTSLYHVTGHTAVEVMGQTRDDAVGEAFDKVAKMLGLGYPGGPVISRLAEHGNPKAIDFPRPYLDKAGFDFSFSGLKSAVARHVQLQESITEAEANDIVAAFQAAAVDVLVYKLFRAAESVNCSRVAIVGGVAANPALRTRATDEATSKQMTIHVPSIELCGDNAAMIAGAGYHYLVEGKRSGLDDDVFSTNRIGV